MRAMLTARVSEREGESVDFLVVTTECYQKILRLKQPIVSSLYTIIELIHI